MTATPKQQIQALRDASHLAALARQLQQWLSEAMGLSEPLSESRARAILRGAKVLDEATQVSFVRLMQKEANLRLALHDLLEHTAVSHPFTPPYSAQSEEIEWLSLVLLTFAHKNGYPVGNLNPAVPPTPHSPAGLLLQQVGGFFRKETQRSATERERAARALAYVGATGETVDGSPPLAPVPPYFRSPVPVRYPEFNDPVTVDEGALDESGGVLRVEEVEEVVERNTAVSSSPTHLTITPEETRSTPMPPAQRMPGFRVTVEQVTPPPIRIVGDPVPVPRPPQNDPGRDSATNLFDNIRNLFKGEEFASTRLRVLVQEHLDGAGLYGLQVKVTCKGVRSYVAGTTDRQGRFVCELPVRETSGLTYDVEVVWPRETGGETELKSITLSADREEYELPFYRQLTAS